MTGESSDATTANSRAGSLPRNLTEAYRGRSPGPYEPNTSWSTWLNLINNFLELREVEEEKKKRLIFLQEVGTVKYGTLESLLQGERPESTEYKTLCELLGNYHKPKRLLLAERFKLMKVTQKSNQALKEFYTELHTVANECGFEKDHKLREAFVTMVFIGGIACVDTRRKLLEKENLSPKEALELAESYERVSSNATHLKEGIPSVGVARVFHEGERKDAGRGHAGRSQYSKHKPNNKSQHHSRYQSKHRPPSGHQQAGCFACGEQGHRKYQCKIAHKLVCAICKAHGHASKVCRKKSSRQVNWYEESDYHSEHSSSDEMVCAMKMKPTGFRLASQPKKRYKGKPRNMHCNAVVGMEAARVQKPAQKAIRRVIEPARMLKFEMNGVAVACELDTGASCSIIDESTWENIGSPPLMEATSRPYAFNNSPIKLKGTCSVEIQFDGKETVMLIHVLDREGHNICGRDMIRELKIDCGPHYGAVREVKEKDALSIKQELTRILTENKEVFTPGPGKCVTTKASLKMKSEKPEPVFRRARPVPFALRPKVEAKLKEMIDKGTIRPVEHSEWATPLVVVPKPGGKIRLCGDYKVTVNPQLDINQYPLPIPDDLFHLLNGGKKFSKMDLSDAYTQVELDEESMKYTTINTHKGLFEYTSIPFGVASAPAIFQKTMEMTLAGIEGVLIYLDDITVTAPDDKTHLERLEKVMNRLKTAGFRLKREKCEFLKEQMEFLGHLVDAQGIRPSPEKLKGMVNMPEPKNLKEVESFIGMVKYYGKFVPNLSTLAAPMNGLRKKDVKFVWGKEQKEAFEAIKKRLMAADVLTHYDPKIPVVLATDASEYGIGAVVYHQYSDKSEKVIAYASRSLTKEERNYAQIEKEALGIVYGVEKFNQFLYGRKFTLLTDHKPLVTIFGPKSGIPTIAAKRLHRWSLRLMIYSFDIEYRNTHEFGNADGLSRLPDPRELPSSEMVVHEVHSGELEDESLRDIPMTEEETQKATLEDPTLSKVLEYIRNGWPEKVKDESLKPYAVRATELGVRKGCILWENRVVIPYKFQKRVLGMLHSSHYGRNRMVSLARSKVWYPGMDGDINKVAMSCETCAVFGNNPTKTPLHPWEEPRNPWQRIHMDFCETNTGDKWLIVVDAKSKWPEAIRMRSTTTISMINQLQQLFSIHGLPEQVVSDNGPQFASNEFKQYCRARNIEQTFTPPYHPNSNGEAERFVQTFKQGLYKGVRSGKSVSQAQTDLLFQYRVTVHPATGKSPSEELMGRKLRTVLDIVKTDKGVIPDNRYREYMKKHYGGNSAQKEFVVGQEVYVRNYAHHGDKWIPGIVTDKYGTNTYEVHFGTGHRKVHADQMKRKVTFWENADDTVLIKKQAAAAARETNQAGNAPQRHANAPGRPGNHAGMRGMAPRGSVLPQRRATLAAPPGTAGRGMQNANANNPVRQSTRQRVPTDRFKSYMSARNKINRIVEKNTTERDKKQVEPRPQTASIKGKARDREPLVMDPTSGASGPPVYPQMIYPAPHHSQPQMPPQPHPLFNYVPQGYGVIQETARLQAKNEGLKAELKAASELAQRLQRLLDVERQRNVRLKEVSRGGKTERRRGGPRAPRNQGLRNPGHRQMAQEPVDVNPREEAPEERAANLSDSE